MKLVSFLLRLNSMPVSIINEIEKKSRVVQSSRPSLGKILYNHISFFKNFPNKSPVCCCSSPTHTYRFPSSLPPAFSVILSQHAGYVVPPSRINHIREISCALSRAVLKLKLFANIITESNATYQPYITLDEMTSLCTIHDVSHSFSLPISRILFLYRCLSVNNRFDADFMNTFSLFTKEVFVLCNSFDPTLHGSPIISDSFLNIFISHDCKHLYFSSALSCPTSSFDDIAFSSVLKSDLKFGSSGSPYDGVWWESGIVLPLATTDATIFATMWALFSTAYSSHDCHFFCVVMGAPVGLLATLLNHHCVNLLYELKPFSVSLSSSPFVKSTSYNTLPITIYCISNYNFTLSPNFLTRSATFFGRKPLIYQCHGSRFNAHSFFDCLSHKYGNGFDFFSFRSRWSVVCTSRLRSLSISPYAISGTLIAVLSLQHHLHYIGFREFHRLPKLIESSISNCHFPSQILFSQIRKCKEALSGWIISSIDKNTHKFILLCPVLAYKMGLENLITNRNNYDLVASGTSDVRSSISYILTQWRHTHLQHNWQNIHPFATALNFPYAYLLPKWKDVSMLVQDFRCRPIVSCYRHPCEKLFHCVGKAVLLCLRNANFTHFSLWRTQDTKDWISSLAVPSQLPYGQDTRFLFGVGDISNMYDKLAHAYIIDCLQWLFESAYKVSRHYSRFHINHDSDSAFFGRAYDSMACCEFSADDAFNIAMFCIENAYFTVGQHRLLRQIFGVPMGGQLSSALAILVCVRGEHSTFASLGADLKLFNAKRYVDDLAHVVFYKHKDPRTLARAHCLLYKLRNCYHSSLILKPGEVINNSFVFLDCIISSSDHTLSVSYFNKNQKAIFSGLQNTTRFAPFPSFGPDHIKRNSLSNALTRIANSCTALEAFLPNACCILAEFMICSHYPKRFLVKQLSRMLSSHSSIPMIGVLFKIFKYRSPYDVLEHIRNNRFLGLSIIFC